MMGKLTSLDINNNKIGKEGAEAIAKMGNLTSLNIYRNGIDKEGAKAIATMGNLTSLDINNNQIGEEGAEAIATMGNLTSLDIIYTKHKASQDHRQIIALKVFFLTCDDFFEVIILRSVSIIS